MVFTALSPLPTPSTNRPAASSATVAAAAAVTAGWRVSKFVTQVPSRIRDVRSAARASAAHTSRHRNRESGIHATAKPAASAATTASATSVTGRHGGIRIPKDAPLLSQLETGRSSASLATLSRLASAYEVSLEQLFAGNLPETARVVRRHERAALPCLFPNCADWLVAPESGAFSVLVSVVEPRTGAGPPATGPGGQKFLYLLRGVAELQVGDEQYVLHPGDAAGFDSAQPHTVANPGWEPAELLAVISAQPAAGPPGRRRAGS
jgi:quercetin dioxygenase-like cupin family protein